MYKIKNILLVDMLRNGDFEEGQIMNVLFHGNKVATFQVKECDGDQYLIDLQDNEEVACSYLTAYGFEFEITNQILK